MSDNDSLHRDRTQPGVNATGAAAAGGKTGTPGQTRPWRRVVVFGVFILGLWVFSDWLLVWAGRSQVVAVAATVTQDLGRFGKGGGKYRYLVRYGVPGKDSPVERQLGFSNPVQTGSQLSIEYHEGKPGKLYKVDGKYHITAEKKYYLIGSLIVLVLLAFNWRRQKKTSAAR